MSKTDSPDALKDALTQAMEIVDEVIPWGPNNRQDDLTYLRGTALRMVFERLLEEINRVPDPGGSAAVQRSART
jgi:hypothetical protein